MIARVSPISAAAVEHGLVLRAKSRYPALELLCNNVSGTSKHRENEMRVENSRDDERESKSSTSRRRTRKEGWTLKLRGEAKRTEVFREHGGEMEGEEKVNRCPNMEGKVIARQALSSGS